MTRTMKTTMALAALGVFAGAEPAAASQQADVAVVTEGATPPPPPTRAERARALKQEAEALFSTPKQWRKAARLLEQSAELREANDPEVYVCLLYAGRINAALGDMTRARQALERAANHALLRGAVVEAAHAFVDAAFVAVEEKQPKVAAELAERGRLLAESPLLTPEQKHQVIVRVRSDR